jgi:hypothetical protein
MKKRYLIGWNASHRLAFSGVSGRAYAEQREAIQVALRSVGTTYGLIDNLTPFFGDNELVKEIPHPASPIFCRTSPGLFDRTVQERRFTRFKSTVKQVSSN